MSKIYLSNNQDIDISEVSALDTSHTLSSEIITIEFKDHSSKELTYNKPFNRDYDFDKLKEAYDNFNGVEDEEIKHYEGETLL